ncbi:mitochondrial transcription rescue factor 1 [Glossina fuscipes]|uniref:Mitochondrial transcription rescue factor 1 n=1 Tax=Glossina fuscipes TaxID=7396 RepID=A0A9C5ZBH2_9MUSC|nr:mitochondrial transcription rescue factor 1 [Glossina fuscipes]
MLLRNYNLIRLLKSAKLQPVYPGGNAAKDCSIFEENAAKHICLTSLTKNIHFTSFVNKYKKTSSTRDDMDTDSDEETESEFKNERDSKIIKAKVNSLRADLVLKAGLNVARNKIEMLFYESKIRVNGKKLLKKSILLNENDEVDVIRGFSQSNPSHLIVSRIVILSATGLDEGCRVNLRRYKSLLIENYSKENAYKSSETSTNQ